MNDPYKVLGISRNASDDEVKKAYRAMARKYHPDKNPGNKAAEDMFKVVQEAYTQIQDERKHGGRSSGGYSGGYSGYNAYQNGGAYGGSYGANQQTYYGSPENAQMYQAAVNYINARHFREAMNVLMGVKDRDAMWYYLMALTNAGLGNNYEAVQQAQTAAQMEPGNEMFQNLVSQLTGGMYRYSNMQNGYGYGAGGIDQNWCAQMCALNLCLNCLCC
ncbi:MAG: DnaJ domain-containing protein [Anaerovoracaceae bacterium]|jgi:molecular chaperone DnaJ